MAVKSSFKSFLNIPGPYRLPIIGNLYLYKFGSSNILKYHELLEKLFKTYGPLVKHTLGNKTIIYVFDPDDIQTVYRNESHIPIVVPLLETAKWYREKNNMSLGLGFMNGEDWYRLRRAVRKMMLRPKEVHYYLPFIQEVASDFVNRIEEKTKYHEDDYDLSKEVAKWAMESAGLICFEERLGFMSNEEAEMKCEKIILAHHKIFEITAYLKFSLPLHNYISTPKWKNLIKAEDFFYSHTTGYIYQTINKLKTNINENGNQDNKFNFVSYLLSREDLTEKDIIIITFSMFTDGLSTTVPALLYNLHTLASNVHVQERVYEEIRSVFRKCDVITADALNNLPLLKAAVKETFRFYPIGTEVSRLTEKDLILSGYEVPSGTHVDLCPMVNFTSEKYFSNAKMFNPERWLRNIQKSSVHPYLLKPFGHGTRSCAGQRFAEQQLYVVLCLLLQKFQLRCTHSKPLSQVYNTLLFPDGPVKIHFIPRS